MILPLIVLDPDILAVFDRSVINARDGQTAEEIVIAEIEDLGGERGVRILIAGGTCSRIVSKSGVRSLESSFNVLLGHASAADGVDRREIYLDVVERRAP